MPSGQPTNAQSRARTPESRPFVRRISMAGTVLVLLGLVAALAGSVASSTPSVLTGVIFLAVGLWLLAKAGRMVPTRTVSRKVGTTDADRGRPTTGLSSRRRSAYGYVLLFVFAVAGLYGVILLRERHLRGQRARAQAEQAEIEANRQAAEVRRQQADRLATEEPRVKKFARYVASLLTPKAGVSGKNELYLGRMPSRGELEARMGPPDFIRTADRTRKWEYITWDYSDPDADVWLDSAIDSYEITPTGARFGPAQPRPPGSYSRLLHVKHLYEFVFGDGNTFGTDTVTDVGLVDGGHWCEISIVGRSCVQ